MPSSRTKSSTKPKAARAGAAVAEPPPRAIEGLDRTDQRILRVLQRDGRITNLELAQQVHLSPTAVLERVKRLTRDGVILGYEARLNPARLGAAMLVFIEVMLDRTAPDVMESFRAAVQVRPEILECHLVAGGFDYLIKTRVADMAAYREMLASVIWALPGVRETRTYAVMEEVKNTTALPL
ncbi:MULTISPECIES: Lrp/AsnC ligand binding domain-containing protein [unclassified Methylibium]|uniref:Lrp/AsnC ligand binding domain-containing protein n=1 Tax=unclassified Methylibium TaxID=2633235 RepID=UPI0003F46A97|nr:MULTISPECIES: Lrp/AsnC ligand binding domain-containing protein [unclassified Methylibium]EWS52875.1 Leucine-responsive regulatory protein [Methylibium sp. T29]EWS57868.1 Leucine-responsive regulatory protein [Methylibium sp. T29-B]